MDWRRSFSFRKEQKYADVKNGIHALFYFDLESVDNVFVTMFCNSSAFVFPQLSIDSFNWQELMSQSYLLYYKNRPCYRYIVIAITGKQILKLKQIFSKGLGGVALLVIDKTKVFSVSVSHRNYGYCGNIWTLCFRAPEDWKSTVV